MNQKQLEAAIRRVSNDPTLEPQVRSNQTVLMSAASCCGYCSRVWLPRPGSEAGGVFGWMCGGIELGPCVMLGREWNQRPTCCVSLAIEPGLAHCCPMANPAHRCFCWPLFP